MSVITYLIGYLIGCILGGMVAVVVGCSAGIKVVDFLQQPSKQEKETYKKRYDNFVKIYMEPSIGRYDIDNGLIFNNMELPYEKL